MGDDAAFCFKGRVIKSYSNEVEPIAATCVSPDDEIVVSCHKEKVMLWNVKSGDDIGHLDGHRADISCCSISDGLLATGSVNGIVHLWRYKELKRVARIGLPQTPINTVALSPNGQLLAVACGDGKPRIYTIYGGDGSLLQGPSYTELNGHTGAITDMAFSPNSVDLLTASKDGTVRLWKAPTGECQGALDPNEGEILKASFSAGSNIVFISEKGLSIWCMADNELKWQIEGGFQLMSCSTSNQTIATVTTNGRLSCFNISSQKETVKKGTAHTDDILSCVSLSSGRNFLTGGADGKLFLWE